MLQNRTVLESTKIHVSRETPTWLTLSARCSLQGPALYRTVAAGWMGVVRDVVTGAGQRRTVLGRRAEQANSATEINRRRICMTATADRRRLRQSDRKTT